MSMRVVGVITVAAVWGCVQVPPCPPAASVAPPPQPSAQPKVEVVLAQYHENFKPTVAKKGSNLPTLGSEFVTAGIATERGSGLSFPRRQLEKHVPAFPVDLDAAFDAIHSMSAKVLIAHEAEMIAAVEKRTKALLAGETLLGERRDLTTVTISIAKDNRRMVIDVSRQIAQDIRGPLEEPPMAKCAPGQPCAQMAPYARTITASATTAIRCVLEADGALVEQTVYLPAGA